MTLSINVTLQSLWIPGWAACTDRPACVRVYISVQQRDSISPTHQSRTHLCPMSMHTNTDTHALIVGGHQILSWSCNITDIYPRNPSDPLYVTKLQQPHKTFSFERANTICFPPTWRRLAGAISTIDLTVTKITAGIVCRWQRLDYQVLRKSWLKKFHIRFYLLRCANLLAVMICWVVWSILTHLL